MISPLVTLKSRSCVIGGVGCRAGVKRVPETRCARQRHAGARQFFGAEVPGDQAGHCRLQPVSDTAGEVLSPATIVSTLNRSSGSPAAFDSASPTKADVMSWWSPLR